MWIAKIDVAQAFTLSDNLEKTQICVGWMKKRLKNEPICVLIFKRILINVGFPNGLVVKNPPTMQEMKIRSLGQEDPLEEEMATHSIILAWKIFQG